MKDFISFATDNENMNNFVSLATDNKNMNNFISLATDNEIIKDFISFFPILCGFNFFFNKYNKKTCTFFIFCL